MDRDQVIGQALGTQRNNKGEVERNRFSIEEKLFKPHLHWVV
jgi:hypothetical protein